MLSEKEAKKILQRLFAQLSHAQSYQVSRIKREIRRIIMDNTQADDVQFLNKNAHINNDKYILPKEE